MELQRENVRVNAMRFQGYVITKKRYAVLLSITCAMIYGSSYIGRLNFSAALPYMLKDNLLTKAQAALVSGGYFFSYGIGQLVNGRLTDRSQPEYRIISGCIGAACANLLMPFSGSFILMPLLWISNGFFQSMLWRCQSLCPHSEYRSRVRLHHCLSSLRRNIEKSLLEEFVLYCRRDYALCLYSIYPIDETCCQKQSSKHRLRFSLRGEHIRQRSVHIYPCAEHVTALDGLRSCSISRSHHDTRNAQGRHYSLGSLLHE